MPENSLFAIVLAAGSASRYGATKQLAEFNGRPLVCRAARVAESVCARNSVLVVGNDWQKVAAACEPLLGFMVVNDNYAEGIGASLSAGVSSVAEVAGAVLILLADQPLITQGHLQQLIEAWRASPNSIVASAYAGTAGPPVIFPRAYFADLMSLTKDRGARSILGAARDRVLTVRCDDAAIDIDEPGDLDRL